jgi:hypothetical protein
MSFSQESLLYSHKLKLIFENHPYHYEINNTPLDKRLRNAYDTLDKDSMIENINDVEVEYLYKESWYFFLDLVKNVRNKRKARFNNVCAKLKDNPGICYQLQNSESFKYNEIEGLWLVIRGDIWRILNPNIYIDNSDIEPIDAVFLQFQDIHTDDYEICWKSRKNVCQNTRLIEQVYTFVQKRYVSRDDIAAWLKLICDGEFGRHFTTIALIRCKDNNDWVPKKQIYYLDPDKIGNVDGILEFDEDGVFQSIPLKPKKNTAALQRTMLLTNEDCEKYCKLVKADDSKPYAYNAHYYANHRLKCYYQGIVYNLEFSYKEYFQYIENEIENICVK